MTYLIILNDAPHQSERAWNALRLAKSLAGTGATVRLFLFGEGVRSGLAGRAIPEGGHDVEVLLKEFLAIGGEVAACKTCMEARELAQSDLVMGAQIRTLVDLTAWTSLSDKVLVF